jgi:hypothetical protein
MLGGWLFVHSTIPRLVHTMHKSTTPRTTSFEVPDQTHHPLLVRPIPALASVSPHVQFAYKAVAWAEPSRSQALIDGFGLA